MRSRQLVLVTVLFEIIAVPLAASAPSSGIYWSQPAIPNVSPAVIWRADFDGSNIQAIVTQGLSGPWPVVADVSTHKIYWGDVNLNRIQRANLDGTSIETVVSGPFNFIEDPAGLAIDPQNQRLYWTDFNVDKIARTDLIAHTTVTLVTGEKDIPLGIDLNLDAGLMYWVDSGTGKLRRAQLDGTSVQDVLTGLNSPRDLALDLEHGRVFWNLGNGNMWRANLDGTNSERIDFGFTSDGFLTLDRLDRKLYYMDYRGIVRADLDGTHRELVIPTSDLIRAGFGLAVVHDCNENLIDDYDELSNNDCNGNRNPDDCDPDTDGDGVTDDCDNCPQIPNADQLDCNGNGIGNACEPNPADADDDSDGVCNGADGCPLDPEKTEPGICGCGVSDADSDGDGVADCDDLCPGSPDVDSDGDSVLDCNDRCPGKDDRIDENANGIPNCLEPAIIPTVSHWGLIILTLLLLIAAKTRFKRLA
jgi:low density lipoprotein receptor-related protein 5/6